MDMKSLMRQAQRNAKKNAKIQEEVANASFEGSSGGGMVKVEISGAGNANKISIDDSLINKDEKDILEDLIIATFNDAKRKADEGSNSALKAATAGIPLPAGFKF